MNWGFFRDIFWVRQAGLLTLVFCVSFSGMGTKVMAQGSVEISSPEESLDDSLSSLDQKHSPIAFTLESAVDFGELGAKSKSNSMVGGQSMTTPLMTPAVFPYQIDPISAFLAASIVLAIQSKREQGSVDYKAIMRFLSSTDLYAGVAGSAFAAGTRQMAFNLGAPIMKAITPQAIQQAMAKSRIMGYVSNVLNGISYTLAVGYGYEYFSQFWKLATKNVEGVDTVADLFSAPSSSFKAVGGNLINFVARERMRSRILNSIYYHRIYTYEFITMNLGLYVGLVIGDIVASKVGPQDPTGVKQKIGRLLVDYIGRVAGGVLGGVALQLIPNSFRMSVNSQFLDWKIAEIQTKVKRLTLSFDRRLARRDFRPVNRSISGEFFHDPLDLYSSMEKLIRNRDLLLALQIQKLLATDNVQRAVENIEFSHIAVEGEFEQWLDEIDMRAESRLRAKHGSGTLKRLSDEDYEDLKEQEIDEDLWDSHYHQVLSVGRERLQQTWNQIQEISGIVMKMRPDIPSSVVD